MGTFKIIWSIWERWGGGCGRVRLHSGTHGVHMSEDNLRCCLSSYTMLGLGPLVGPQPLHKLGQLPSSLEKFCFLSPISLEVCEEHRCTLHSWLYVSPVHPNLGSQNAQQAVHLRNHLPALCGWLILWGDQAWVTLTVWQHCDGSQSSVTSLEHFLRWPT